MRHKGEWVVSLQWSYHARGWFGKQVIGIKQEKKCISVLAIDNLRTSFVVVLESIL